MTGRPQNEETLYHAVLGRPPVERLAYLKAACGEDLELLERVESLLKIREARDNFLESPPFIEELHANTALSEGPGTVVGRYKLLEKIGEGGMAVVYMAESATGGPIRRKVALKIIKLGMDTKQVIARFEAERQALALMDHPSIAKVLDAGATETGRPYFVMELVQGVSITEYCDRNSLGTKDRLALFVQVCHAVQHAHQKGIIHRDIKPSNVMVTHHDGKPVPKVIDFGIAKATSQKLTEKTLFTRYAHLIGTPAYMSPEQAELSDLDVDTRTDIYSLGVLLYELLTGTTPFSEEELRKAGYVEMQRVIREQEPVKPSTRIRTAHVARASCPCVPESTGGTPMLREVRGDLDWIVMKSLEKDRARRYETPNGLAEDIRRHLEHEPVLARGPSATYRLRKFLRRHRVQAGILLVIAAAAVAVGSILSLWNRDRAQLAEAEGFKHRGILSQAREQYAKADREAALETIRPILASRHLGPEALLLQATILVDNRRSDEATAILGNLFAERPEVAGAAHSLLARILWESKSPNAEMLKEIEEHRKQAEAMLPETAEAYFLRTMTAVTVKEQLASLDKALQLDPAHYESRRLRTFTYYASRKYEKMKDDALGMTILRPRDPLGYSLRATAWRELGRYPEAIGDYDIAISLATPGDPQHADWSAERCEVFVRMGDYEHAAAEAQESLKFSPDKAVFQYYRFSALTALGEYDEAVVLFRQIIGPGHDARRQFQDWCMKYVFDTLEARRSWHPADSGPTGPAFLPMVEAEEIYQGLVAKGGHRLTTDGFSAAWSPDGKKLAFSLGVHGYSGVAVYDPATKEIDLLIVPGKDPRWSPDGKSIAFVRDCRFLRVSEFMAAERSNQHRLMEDEEVWVMKTDGTDPRRLARGGWPSWSQDSAAIYYHSRMESALYSISVVDAYAEPKRIVTCSNSWPSVSPDNQSVAHLEGGSLKVKKLPSGVSGAEWLSPFTTWGGAAWSSTTSELCLGGRNNNDDGTGLWIYSLDRSEPVRVLDGQITAGALAPDGAKLIFCLGPPYFELWTADLDPSIPTIEALSPGQTITEHSRNMVAFYSRRIEADPQDAYAYSGRMYYHDFLKEQEKAQADMRRWSAILSQELSYKEAQLDVPRDVRRVIKGPFGCGLVLSGERRRNGANLLRVAFGQKGRCEMKLFEIPMFVASLFGVCVVSGLDAPPAHADFTFGEPVNLRSIIPWMDPVHEGPTCFSYDGLEMYIESDRAGTVGGFDLWVLRRASTDEDWGLPENLGTNVNTTKNEGGASISADGLTLYFSSDIDRQWPDIYVTTRPTASARWGPPVSLGPKVNTADGNGGPWISPDGLELFFWSYVSGGYGRSDLYVLRRATTNDPWSDPVNLGPIVNTTTEDISPCLSPDGLLLFFCDNFAWGDPPRPGGRGGADIWMTRRATVSSPWQTPVNLGLRVNSSIHDVVPRISSDGSMLYFVTAKSMDFNTWENWQVPIIPIVDFTGDGQVDGKDLLTMIVQLGGNDPLCDIGPFAWGDGVVDAKDLEVLAGYIGKEFEDPTLVAHWAFDETEGSIAVDSAGDYDGSVIAGATWQPEGGMVGGALNCDGVTGCVVTDTITDLGTGPFSVIAWVKGGAPGQIILSHSGATDWLMANPIDGSLMTKLTSTTQPLAIGTSEAAITDGKWHRIALVWDGIDRILYADGKEVARDPQPDITVSDGEFMIGVSNKAGTLWSGLIDDVRIYNRVIKP